MNGKYTNIDEIIEKISRYRLSDFTIEEVKEWTWEALSKIASPSIYVDKIAVLEVSNGRSIIPNDCFDITESQLREYYSKCHIRKSTDVFFNTDELSVQSQDVSVFAEIAKSIVYDSDGNLVDNSESFLVEYPPLEQAMTSLTYSISNGYFVFGFKSGLVEFAYKAFPIDSNGDPMIPDNAKCIDAIVYYCLEIIMLRMWIEDKISERKYNEISKKRAWAIGSARSHMNIGTIDDWSNFGRDFMRLRRDINQDVNSFKGLGSRENLNI